MPLYMLQQNQINQIINLLFYDSVVYYEYREVINSRLVDNRKLNGHSSNFCKDFGRKCFPFINCRSRNILKMPFISTFLFD